MVTTTKKEKTGFYIAMSCPGCGGELEIEDNFFAIECHHCGLKHRLIMPEAPPAYVVEAKTDQRSARFSIDRYLKKIAHPLTTSDFQLKQVYYPYWKIDAVLFRVRKRIEKRIVMNEYETDSEVSFEQEKTDISLAPYTTSITAGVNFDGIPATLGARSSYLKLKPLSDEHMIHEYDMLPVMTPWEEVRASLTGRVGAIASFDNNLFGANKTELFCPRASLLYFPFLVFDFYDDDGFNRFVIDGVTGRVLDHVTELNLNNSFSSDIPEIEFGEIKIEKHQCGTCGEDLPVTESLVYICHNCQRLTDLEPGTELSSLTGIDSPDSDSDIMIPFWSLKMNKEDAKKLKPMFGGIFQSDSMVIPAFRINNIDAMSRLTKRISSAYPQFRFKKLLELDNRFHPVNLPLTEAVMLADVFIHKDRYVRGMNPKNETESFIPTEVSLFFAPFRLENYFYVDSALNAITFEKNLI